ncbi:MAG: hypothetical protein ACLR1A_09635 [Eubacterium ventriosum]
MESEEKKKAYNEYVERITPNNSLTKDMWNAFDRRSMCYGTDLA